jgi:hypothetical protein
METQNTEGERLLFVLGTDCNCMLCCVVERVEGVCGVSGVYRQELPTFGHRVQPLNRIRKV